MNHHRIHVLTRPFTDFPSRRDALCRLAGLGLGFGLLRSPNAADARKKRKRKRKMKNKKAKPNAFGCLSVGQTCKHADQCCSGICEGKKGQRKCQAHGTGTCDQKAPGICTAPNPLLTRCNNNNQCNCIRTTAGSNFCIDLGPGTGTTGSDCADCKQDADCEALGFPPGSACVPVFEGACAGNCAGGMMCAAPCGYLPPEPE